MSKRKPTRYQNVFYRETTTNGKSDKTYYIRFNDHGKDKEIKIGKHTSGTRSNFCYQKLIAIGMTLLSLSTGGRLNTIMQIAKKDVDLTNNMLTLKDVKNNDTYGGFINEEVKTMLQERMQFLRPNDKIIQMNERTLRRKLSIILTKLFNHELEHDDRKNRVVIHTLRHTFASQLAINGTPIFTIQKLLNHKDIKQTLRYAKLAPDSGRDMVDQLMVNFL